MSIDNGFPQPTEAELEAEPTLWLAFNPFWWRIVQGKIAELKNPHLWDNYTSEIDQAIENLMYPHEP